MACGFRSAHNVQTRSLNYLWYETEEKLKKVATVVYARIQEKKEWFDEECATVNEEKNCARTRAIQIQNRTRAAKLTAMNEYKHEEGKITCLERWMDGYQWVE
jgi:hypothetical protein